ncbi:MAG: hypothetical protein GEU73_18040, partial [Chloroflexi bacterium]|nr:hypothetical protein [Chloroflexota bacterium]
MEQMAMEVGRRVDDRPLLRRLGLTSEKPLPWLLLAVLWLAAFSIFPLLYAIYRSFFESTSSG